MITLKIIYLTSMIYYKWAPKTLLFSEVINLYMNTSSVELGLYLYNSNKDCVLVPGCFFVFELACMPITFRGVTKFYMYYFNNARTQTALQAKLCHSYSYCPKPTAKLFPGGYLFM